MSIGTLGIMLTAAAMLGWHARDRIDVPPGMDATIAKRLTRRVWRAMRRVL